VGLGVTATLQALVFLASGSVALLADTIHNFADALTALPLGVAFVLGRRPPNKRYTYGYGKAEDLAGVFIVTTIAISSAVAGWAAVRRLTHTQNMQHVGWVLAAGLIGFAGNELVAVYRIRVGRRIGSAALIADGLHSRTDGFTSLAVVLGALGAYAGWDVADPIIGLVITLAILVILKGAVRDIYRRLMDSVDPALVDQATQVLSSVKGIEDVDGLHVRWVGHELWLEAEVVSDCELSLAGSHAISEEGRHRLLHEIPRLRHVVIHSDPCAHNGVDHHRLTAHHF